MSARITLTDTSSFTTKSAEVIKFRSSDATAFDEINVIDNRSVERENAFNADTETGFSNRDCFACASVLPSNYHTFESLESFFGLGFFDPHMYTNGIARLEPRNVFTQLRLFNSV